MQAEGPFVVSYNKSPAVSSPGSWAQWLSDAVRFCCPQRPDSDAFPVPAKLCWLQAPHPPHTAKSKAWAIPSPPPHASLTEREQNFYRNLPADPSSQFVGQNWVACQSSLSHCGGNGTTTIGFDKSEPASQRGRVGSGDLTEVLPADRRENVRLGRVDQHWWLTQHRDQALGYRRAQGGEEIRKQDIQATQSPRKFLEH